ncbi:hypothetical protein TNCV_1673981 [Trichonephila clavipes]|nr:hypothetical protein TNCV_1673981 [Trichonephila clavipes]
MVTAWYARQLSRSLGHSDFTMRKCWGISGQASLLHGDQPQEALNRPIVEKTIASYDMHNTNCLFVYHPYKDKTFTMDLCVSLYHP